MGPLQSMMDVIIVPHKKIEYGAYGGSSCNIPKALFYLLKRDYRLLHSVGFWAECPHCVYSHTLEPHLPGHWVTGPVLDKAENTLRFMYTT